MRRTWAAAFLAGCASLLPAPADAASSARVGLFVEAGAPGGADVADAFADAVRARPGAAVEVVRRTAGPDEAETRAALAELAHLGVDVVVAVGDAAARAAPEAVRDRPVVVVSADGAAPGGDRVRGVASTADPARLAARLPAVHPDARRIVVLGPAGGTADALAAAIAAARGEGATVDRVRPSAGGGYVGDALAVAEVVVAAPEIAPAALTDVARACAGQGIVLVGTRADHLEAGAAVVLRVAARDVGAHAAVACLEALEGGRRNGAAPRRVRRLVTEIHLANARRLGVELPLRLLASSDRTVAPRTDRR